ncbi:MAG: serine/threonine protein kinase [Myxococcales bacterium]|nr:serine/threonine protein kinase [Myxococcales bacterium]MBK7197748.1 serine/threonine protein kinase [Myxococcales bacterium]MBP6844416.1 serine/threonine protein kinase [Kofleriaceae bacterium]
MLGQTLGSYTIERELGRGGMGAVYAAVHTLLGRRAAVKVLLAELSRDQAQVQRFFNEARAATAIKHPSIVEIYDFGWAADGSAYIVMELMDGEPLSARLKRIGRLSVAQAATIARQAATALAAAHRAGIVHRDLKPDNVFLVPDEEVAGGERVKLLDFGIAKLAAPGAASRTTTGAIMGTPLYMSPEQCEGARAVDHRTDLYALGCVLFEMVAGRVPFISDGVGGLIGMHLHVPPPRLRELAPDAPAELEAIVARLLAKAPDDRYQTADEVAAALARVAGVAITAPGPAAAPPSALTPAATAGGATTLSAAASAHAAQPVAAGGGRRGLWIALGGAAVVAGAAIAVVVASGGGGAPTPVASAAAPDAAPAASPSADAAIAIDPLLQPAQRALAEGRFDVAVAVADEILRGDPTNAAAAAVREEAVRARDAAAALVTARAAIEKLVKGGRCSTARKQAAEAVAALGEPAQPLVALAAACKEAKASSGDAPGGPEVPTIGGPLPRELFLATWNQQRGRIQQCGTRLNLEGGYKATMVITPSGAVTEVSATGASPEGARCVEAAVRSIRFPSSGAGLTVTMPVKFRPAPTTGPLPEPDPLKP